MSQTFDAIYVGGQAFTSGWESSRPVGVAVRDGRIAAIAADDALRDAGARDVIELRGGLVLPSFHDAHAHPIAGAIELLQCDVSDAVDGDDTLARIAAYARSHPDEPWIRGGGWSMPHFPGGTPSRTLLDAIVPDRPVVLQNRDHHGVWVNSRALELAGITSATPDPADGRIERDLDGSPAGVLHEGAMKLMDVVVPAVEPAFALRALERAQQEFFAQGIVGWQDAWVGKTAGVIDLLDTYLEGVTTGILRARVTAALWWERAEGMAQLDSLRERRERVSALGRPDILIADTVKIMVDGVAENYTAALSLPYLDAHGHSTGERGLTFLNAAELTEAVMALDAVGVSVHLHALGDRAVTISLDAVSAARAANGPSPTRHQLAHLQVVQCSDVRRFAELGVIANLQMLWGAVDDQLDELTFPFIAPELVGRHYPFRELRDAGALMAGGSDWPVSTADPIQAVHVAVNRAAPGATADARIDPSQAIDVATALSLYTAGSAHAGGRGDSTGALRDGLLADLAVLSADPFSTEPSTLHEITVQRTVLGGAPVYRREAG
jgi:predicted amidohydrolase YtcJ